MRTTIRLDDNLMQQVKRTARARGETLTNMIERGLRLLLAGSQPRRSRKRVKLPVSRARGGMLPGVNLDDSSALLDRMDGRR